MGTQKGRTDLLKGMEYKGYQWKGNGHDKNDSENGMETHDLLKGIRREWNRHNGKW